MRGSASSLRVAVAALALLVLWTASAPAQAQGDGGGGATKVLFPTVSSLVLPPQKDLCKDEVWRTLADDRRVAFENQGRCVSHALHGDALVAPALTDLHAWTLLPRPADTKTCTALPVGPCTVSYEGLQVPLDHKTADLVSPRDPPEPRLGVSGEMLQTRNVSVDSSGCLTRADTFSYSAAGRATGPYSGSFVLRGTVTLGPRVEGRQYRRVTRHAATLTIHSPTGTVTADYAPPEGNWSRWGDCVVGRGFSFVRFGGFSPFEATVTAPDGTTFTDSGSSRMEMFFLEFPRLLVRSVSFESDMAGRLPTGASIGLPTSSCPPEGCS